MQVVCGNCQLSFQAPDGATGLVCPICRSPLRAPDATNEPEAQTARQIVDWSGGTLDDLVALLSAPAWSARVEVLPPDGGAAFGEVHVIAGGVSDAIYEGKSTHDALDQLRAIKNTRFRIEPRLPNPSDGDLTFPGPDQGKLEERPLATLMRYCEDYVLTAGIEVWRGSENAKVDYRRGEIVGVTVGGIDAPERLAEVMKWSSGSYRLIAPRLTLPETAPKAAAPATVVASRSSGAASKTIFGMPALDPATLAAATEKIKPAQSQTASPPKGPATPATEQRPSAPSVPAAAAAAPRAPGATSPPAAPAAVAAAVAATAPAARLSTNKTIFGVQAPPAAQPIAAPAATPTTTAPVATPTTAAPVVARPSSPSGPAASPRAGTTTTPPAAAPSTPRPSRPGSTTVPPAAVVAPAAASTPSPAAASARTHAPASGAAHAPTSVATDDRTLPTKTAKQPPRETPVWTYVVVGFFFGLALLGVYRLVILLAH